MQEEVIAESADPGVAQPIAPADPDAPQPDALGGAGRRRRMVYLVPILAAAAAVAIWVGVRGSSPGEPIDFAVDIERPGAATRGGTVHVGDVVRPTVRGAAYRALWVYRDHREIVVACPGAAGCSSNGHQLMLELRLSAPGSYSIIAIVSDRPIAPPNDAVDVMLSAVTGDGARVKITPLEVN
jgi:hypothetical protein